MRQAVITRHGPPEVFEMREGPDPSPSPGELRIRVRASGVNFSDVLSRLGLYPDAPKPPLVVGYEVAGHVDAIGSDVTGFATGDRVVALTRFGGYSDVVVVRAAQCFHFPGELSDAEAASLPVTYLTAALALYRMAALAPGETVLVHNAGGGGGIAAVQLARLRRAIVLGTASPLNDYRLKGGRLRARLKVASRARRCLCAVFVHRARGRAASSPTCAPARKPAESRPPERRWVQTWHVGLKHAALRTFGVEHVIDYTHANVAEEVSRITRGRGVDVILDPIGGSSFTESYRMLAPLGRLIIFGLSAAAPGETRSWWKAFRAWRATPRFDPLSMINRNRGVFGLHVGHLWTEHAQLAPLMEMLLAELRAGRLRPVVAKTFPLDRAADAHRFIQSRANIGKVVLTA